MYTEDVQHSKGKGRVTRVAASSPAGRPMLHMPVQPLQGSVQQ